MKKGILFIVVLCLIGHLRSQLSDSTKNVQHFNEIIIQPQENSDAIEHDPIQESIEDLIEKIPAITLIRRGNYALEPTIRGLNQGQISSTIDGMQIFGACTDRMDPISSYIEPNNLEKIEFHTSIDHHQTESAIGGGINFALRKATLTAPKKWTGKVGTVYQTNGNYLHGLGVLHYSSKRFALLLNGVYRNSGNYWSGERQKIQFSQFEKWNAGINMIYAVNEKNKLSLDYIQDEGYNIGYPALTMDVLFAKAYIGAITHIYEGSEKLRSLENKVFANYINHAMDDTKRPAETVPMHMDMPGQSRTFGFYSKAKLVLAKKHVTHLKVNAFQNDLHAEMTMYPPNGTEMFMLTLPDARKRVIGFDVSDKWWVKSGMDFSYGGRIEANFYSLTSDIGRSTLTAFSNEHPNQFRLTGNIFARYHFKITKNLHLHIDVNYGQRTPTLQEMYGFYLFNRTDNFDFLGNPKLKNEKAISANFGMELVYDKINVSATGFVNRFSNYIVGSVIHDYDNMTIGADGVKQYHNFSNAVLMGGELTLNWEIVKQLSFQSANNFSYGIDSDKDFLPFIPPFRSINTLMYNLKGYLFRVTYTGALSQEYVSYQKYGETRTPGFSLLDFTLQKTFTLRNAMSLIAEAGIENIFDVNYYEHLDVMGIPRMGRNLLLKISLTF